MLYVLIKELHLTERPISIPLPTEVFVPILHWHILWEGDPSLSGPCLQSIYLFIVCLLVSFLNMVDILPAGRYINQYQLGCQPLSQTLTLRRTSVDFVYANYTVV